jgi:hypothetical protein
MIRMGVHDRKNTQSSLINNSSFTRDIEFTNSNAA